MFRVHFPATSYLKKQVKFFGTNHFLAAYHKPLLKSAGLTFVGRGGHEYHSWAPSEEGISEDPDEHDHPPWNHDPKTGELLEGGLHPIDYVHRDLQRRFGMSPEASQKILQEAIDRFNGEDNINHHLPDFDSPQWRKVFVGPHYHRNEQRHMRRTRGADPLYEDGPKPLVTYAYNRNNVEGASTGRWIDSGLIHMNKEIGEVLRGYGVPEDLVKELNYVKYNALLPGSLSGGVVQSIGSQDYDTYKQTGQLPDHYLTPDMQQSMQEQRMHPEVHAHQLAELMPNDAFRMMGAGGRGAGAGFNGEKLQAMFEQLGVEHEFSPEDLNDISRSAMMRLLFQEKSHNLNSDSGGGVGAVFRPIIRGIGSHHNDETYKLHAQHAAGAKTDEKTPFARSANIQAEKMVAHLSHGASKLMSEGMSQEDALNAVLTELRASDAESNVSDEYRNKVQEAINLLLGASGHETFTFGDIPTDYGKHNLESPEIEFGDHEAPEHWAKRIFMGDHELAPVGDTVRDEEVAPTPPAPAPAPPQEDPFAGVGWGPPAAPAPAAPAPAPAPMAAPRPQVIPVPGMRAATPLEAAWQQMRGQPPSQTFFDIGTGGLVQRSNDVASSLDEIRKKMGYFDGFLGGYRK